MDQRVANRYVRGTSGTGIRNFCHAVPRYRIAACEQLHGTRTSVPWFQSEDCGRNHRMEKLPIDRRVMGPISLQDHELTVGPTAELKFVSRHVK